MPGWLAILLAVAACLTLGRLATEAFIRKFGVFQGDWLELGSASLAIGVILLGWIALILAEFGLYSIALLGILWLGLSGILIYIIMKERRPEAISNNDEETTTEPVIDAAEHPANRAKTMASRIPAWGQPLFLSLWLIAAIWLFFRPHQFVKGAADAGVYVNLAASISKSGGIIINDPTLAELDTELYPLLLRELPGENISTQIASYYIFPGFFVQNSPAGQITPQFYPLHPVWQAVAFSLGTVQGALLMTGLWALLGGLALYLVVRELTGWPAAAVALTGLTINALQVWFARYPTTEPLTQYLLWTGIWATMVWVQNRRPLPLWGLLGGMALGQVFLVRIDTYFLLIIPLGLWLWLRWSGRWQRAHWWFFAPIILLTIHSFVHALWQSAPYFFDIYGYGIGLLSRNIALPIGVLLLGLLAFVLLNFYHHRLNELAQYKRSLTWAAVALVLLIAVYGWFIRPNIGGSLGSYEYWYGGGELPVGLDRGNLIRLGWYLSPFGIALATVGICLMVLKINRQTVLILAVGLMFSLLYLWRIQANPHQIYTMRRYVPIVMPFAVVASGYLFGWFFRQRSAWRQIIGVLLGVIWLVSLAVSARGFISQVDDQGLVAKLDALDQLLAPNSVLVFNEDVPITTGDILGTPLRFLYGHEVFSLRDQETVPLVNLEPLIESWQKDGRSIYWIGDTTPLSELDVEIGGTIDHTITSDTLEGLYDAVPQKVVEQSWQLNITQIRPSP